MPKPAGKAMISAVGGEPRRPALRYFGSKWALASWVISHFPPHLSYVEPFAGSCAVLLNKPRCSTETINDLDGRVVNFFRVLREQPDDLIRVLELTPYARAEFFRALTPCPDNPLEDARRFFVASWMSIGGHSRGQTPGNWRYIKSVRDRTGRSPAGYWQLDHLYTVAERLMGVQIECRDAFVLIPHMDTPVTLTYLDPPYVHSTRSRLQHCYDNELSDGDHARLAKRAHDLQGYCVISGYKSDLYADLYESRGWLRVDTDTRTNTTLKNVAKNFVPTQESLWLSPRTVAALKGGLFAPTGVA